MKGTDRLQFVCAAQTFHGNGALMHLKLNVSAQWFHFQARFYSLFTFFIRFFFFSPASKQFYLLLFPHFYRFHFYLFFFIFVVIVICRVWTRVFVEFLRVFFYLFSHCTFMFIRRENLEFIYEIIRCVKCSAFKKPKSQTTAKSYLW